MEVAMLLEKAKSILAPAPAFVQVPAQLRPRSAVDSPQGEERIFS